MYALLGEQLPIGMPHDWSLWDRIRYGHEFLVKVAKVDLGYDPQKWHEHLRTTDAGGYRWSNKHFGFLKKIAAAVKDPEWLAAVEELSREVAARPAD
jgi:hypothetical protein